MSELSVFGVTGTNGKTSCTHFLAEILNALSIPCHLIGTLGYGPIHALKDTGLTTPGPLILQSILTESVQQGAKAIAMEVSSHGIHQNRIQGVDFKVGIFTNLTQDHLDYHKDMASYAAVKRRFFEEFPVEQVVINADDAYGRVWLPVFAVKKTTFAYSITDVKGDVPTTYARQITPTSLGLLVAIDSPWGQGTVELPLVGEFNVSNALAVLTALCAYGLSFKDVVAQLHHIHPVPGRMQKLGGGDVPLVVIDYSHTPDALEKALTALRKQAQGSLICVFGCGGDRDKNKRPQMAAIAEKLADQVIVTNDNPRHELPEAIVEDIWAGFQVPKKVVRLLDRAMAIKHSIQSAGKNDVILIAGKGAEQYQQIGDEKLPFDDIVAAKNNLLDYENKIKQESGESSC